jgi:hypothetical protein
MPQNPIQFQKGLSLNDFIRQFGLEQAVESRAAIWLSANLPQRFSG